MKYPRVIEDRPNYARIQWHEDSNEHYPSISKERKYLCIGGPLDRQKFSSTQLSIKYDNVARYVAYNCANRISRWLRGRRHRNPHSQVWVYADLLK